MWNSWCLSCSPYPGSSWGWGRRPAYWKLTCIPVLYMPVVICASQVHTYVHAVQYANVPVIYIPCIPMAFSSINRSPYVTKEIVVLTVPNGPCTDVIAGGGQKNCVSSWVSNALFKGPHTTHHMPHIIPLILHSRPYKVIVIQFL